MLKGPYTWNKPSVTGSPIGKGQKTKEKVKSIFGRRGTARKFITRR